jgi:hypothetical protein
MTDHREVMRQALAYVEWQAFGSCRSPGWDNAVPLAHEVSEALRAALDEPADANTKLVAMTRKQHEKIVRAVRAHWPGRRDLLAFLGDWPAQEGS